MIKNDAQIEAEMQQEIMKVYPPALYGRVLRKGTKAERAALDKFLDVDMHKLKLQKVAARDQEQALYDYDTATTRLAQPVLDNADYPDERDESGKFTRHHALVADDNERAAAQAVIKAATKATLAIIKKRNAA